MGASGQGAKTDRGIRNGEDEAISFVNEFSERSDIQRSEMNDLRIMLAVNDFGNGDR